MSTQASNEHPGEPWRARSKAASADSRRASRLSHLQDELTALIGEAGAVRSRLPGQLEPDVARLQQQMDLLSERLAALRANAADKNADKETSAQVQLSTPAGSALKRKDPVTRGTAAGTQRAPFENPWDAQSADALMQLYESEEAGLGSHGPAPQASISAAVGRSETPQRPIAMQQAEPRGAARNSRRLEERFADVARQIEQSLSGVKPESSLSGLEHRFEQLEERVGSALKSLATRADARELRNVEAQIAEISAKLVDFRAQLSRLDNIDLQLSLLKKHLSDERLAGLIGEAQVKAADLQGMAATAAMEAASRVADKVSGEAHLRELGEVRSLVEHHISERRAHDANTVGMLETMQQTIVRVMERIDTLELSARQEDAATAVPQELEQEHENSFSAESVEGGLTVDAVARHLAAAEKSDAGQGSTYEVPHYMPVSPRETPDPALADDTSFESEVIFGSGTEIALETNASSGPPPLPGTLEALRRDLIANAQQAREQAAGGLETSSGRADLSADETEKPPVSKRKAGRLRARPSQPRRRLLFFVAVLFLLLPAATLLALKLPSNWQLDGASYSQITTIVENLVSSEPGGADANQKQQIKAPHRKRPEAPAESKTVMGTGNDSSSIVLPGMMVSGGSPVSVVAEPDTASQNEAMPVVLMPGHSASNGDVHQSAIGVEAREGSSGHRLPPPDVGSRELRVAAAQGDPSAQFEVGARLASGHGNLHDIEAAARWFERSASSGFAMSQYRLATLYQKGLGVRRDLDRAKVWYRRAAEQGNLKAMHNLAVLLAGGDDHKPDYSIAAQWFLEAAERGLADSQYNLAILYETGFGVSKDSKQAYKWLMLAAKAGDGEATRRRDAMTLALSAEVRAAAERLVRAWKAKPADPLINDASVAGRAWHPASVRG